VVVLRFLVVMVALLVNGLRVASAQAVEATTAGVDTLGHYIERGGLYSIIAILLVTVAFLYKAKESNAVMFQAKLLQLVESQTAVMTKMTILTEKVETLLTRIMEREFKGG